MKLVLDTSLFTNPDAQRFFGRDSVSAIEEFLKIAREKGIELYLPVSVARELAYMIEPALLARFKREATVRSPDIHNLQVPAAVLHGFIRDLRNRVDRGLRVAEKAIHRGPVEDQIRWLREHYRTALRTGIVDSVEDLDVVLLAKETGAAILSADEGITRMAEELGIEVLTAKEFAERYQPEKLGENVNGKGNL